MSFWKKFEATALDLNTKRSVAFYAALAVACYSGIHDGFNMATGVSLLTMAGLAVGDLSNPPALPSDKP